MGAWNSKPFGNDTAGDWLWELEKAKDASIIQTAFEAVIGGGDIPDAPACEEAVAAAAVVEAARHEPLGKLPPEARQWVSGHGFVPADALVKQAIAAIKKIIGKSELRELWLESKSFANWQQQMKSLLARLVEVQARPAPARKPKAPSAPRLLHKLIEAVSPDDEGPLREKLRQKLETIKDLNRPVAGTFFETALNLVIRKGLLPEAKRLIERGAEINPEIKRPDLMCTPLEQACRSGLLEMVEFLFHAGAAIYAQHDSNYGQGKYSRALEDAVDSGVVGIVEFLMRQGAGLRQVKYDGQTLLHTMLESLKPTSPTMIEFLVRNGLDLEARDEEGKTAFYKAAVMHNQKAMEKLLKLGANANAKNAEGETALDFVKPSRTRSKTFDFLKEHGGRFGKDIPD